MTLQQIKDALRDANLRKVARGASLPYARVWRLMSIDGHKPMHETVEALRNYLSRTASKEKDAA